MNRSLVTWFSVILIFLIEQFARAADGPQLKLDDVASKASFLNPSSAPHLQDDGIPCPQGIKTKESPTNGEEPNPKRIKKEEQTQALTQVPRFPPEGSFLEVVTVPKERGIWCHNLDYQYEGHMVSTYAWHAQTAMVIKQHYEAAVQTLDEKNTMNFLKARIDSLFRTSEGGLKHFSYDVPFIFTSRTMNTDEYWSFGKVINDGNPIDGRDFIGKLQEQVVDLGESDLQADYYHTEHALLLFLLKQDNWIKAIKEGIICGSDTLECLVLVVCSYYDPCSNCSRSFHRAQSSKDYFGQLIRNKCATQGLCPDTHNLNLFVEVSSLSEYQGSRECLAHADAGPYASIINIKDFFPYFAQMAMRVTLSKPPVPSYATTPVIRKTTEVNSETDVLQDSLDSKDFRIQAAIYYKRLYEGKYPEIKQELRKIKSELAELEDLPLAPSVSDVVRVGESFMKDFVEAMTTTTSIEQVLTPSKVEEKLLKILYKEMKHEDKTKFEENLSKEKENEITDHTRGSRLQLLAKYLNPQVYGSVPGQRISSQVIDATNLLKIFGYVYWGDPVPSQVVPNSLKEKPKTKTSGNKEDLLDVLHKTIDKVNQEPRMKDLATFLVAEMEKGKFILRGGKYYWRVYKT